MQKFCLEPTSSTPEIIFSPEENIFLIRGISSPEDVRTVYYPVTEWVKTFIDDILERPVKAYSTDNPLKLQIDLEYFNSSSVKFIYDILLEIKRASKAGIPVIIEWYHDFEDLDLRAAGTEIALLAEMDFIYIQKYK